MFRSYDGNQLYDFKLGLSHDLLKEKLTVSITSTKQLYYLC